MAYASNKRAAQEADKSVKTIEFEGKAYDLCWRDDHILIYDDEEVALRMADVFGTTAKVSPMRHTDGSFAIVPLGKER